MKKDNLKKMLVTQYIIIGLLVCLCFFLFFNTIVKKDNVQNDIKNEVQKNEYDVSMMNEVNVNDILKMFEDGKSYVLYIGRSTCASCKIILPYLQVAQSDLGYVTQYLDITKTDRNSNEWKKLENLLDIETTLSYTKDNGEKELKTDTYGFFIGERGYTPSLIIINKNEMVAGHIGVLELSELKDWLKNNDIK